MRRAEKLLDGPGTPSLESVQELRLTVLLRNLVRDAGRVEAAQVLGVDRKKVWRSLGSGRLTPRLAAAMERILLSTEAVSNLPDTVWRVCRRWDRVNSPDSAWRIREVEQVHVLDLLKVETPWKPSGQVHRQSLDERGSVLGPLLFRLLELDSAASGQPVRGGNGGVH